MAYGVDAKIHLPDDTDNPGPIRHTRTHSDADGDTVHEEVVQVDDTDPILEALTAIKNFAARQVWLLEKHTELDSSDITADDV